jgi:hypothetical protein
VAIFFADLLRGVWLRECAETRGFTVEPQDALNNWLHATSWAIYEGVSGNFIRDEEDDDE